MPAAGASAPKTRRRALWAGILAFLAVLGPGIITGSVDNDVGGITTYSVAGAAYGYGMLWTLVPSFVVLFVVQEMNARMGLATGKGLADLIRENAGVKVTFALFAGLLVTNILNTTTEFAGVAGSMQIFGVPKYLSVPLVAVAVWILVVKGTYKVAERVFLVFSLALLTYIVSAVLGRPQWSEIGTAMAHPDFRGYGVAEYATVIGIVGTTIAPWMQFYMQSSIIEKGLTMKNYRYTVIDVLVGCVATVVVAFFIIVACAATLHANGHTIQTAADAAESLAPLAGMLAEQVFAFALFVASVFSATILPVATAFFVCEAFGYEAGLDRKWKQAPQFYWLYTLIVAVGAAIILIPGAPLIGISLWSQRINGILLPVVLVFMMRLVNDRAIMGEHVNKPLANLVGWTTIAVLTLLSLALLVTSLLPSA